MFIELGIVACLSIITALLLALTRFGTRPGGGAARAGYWASGIMGTLSMLAAIVTLADMVLYVTTGFRVWEFLFEGSPWWAFWKS